MGMAIWNYTQETQNVCLVLPKIRKYQLRERSRGTAQLIG